MNGLIFDIKYMKCFYLHIRIFPFIGTNLRTGKEKYDIGFPCFYSKKKTEETREKSIKLYLTGNHCPKGRVYLTRFLGTI